MTTGSRRPLGAILVVLGIATMLLGAAGMVALDPADASDPTTSPPSSATAVATAPPAPTLTPSPTPAPTPTPSPTPAPTPTPAASPTAPPSPTPVATPDPAAEVRDFIASIVPAIRAADVDVLLPALHPATIDRYGTPGCTAYLAGLDDPTFDVVIDAVSGPAPWDYVTDARTTAIPDAWAVTGEVTANGSTGPRDLHVAFVDGEVRWFTDCGEPLPS